MSMSDITAAFKSGDFDLNKTMSIESTLFCRVYMDKGHSTSTWWQIKSLLKLIGTRNLTFQDYCISNQSEYSSETANIEKRVNGGS